MPTKKQKKGKKATSFSGSTLHPWLPKKAREKETEIKKDNGRSPSWRPLE
jgi:hypothetical protein